MTAMQVLSDSRDSEEIWLARAAPRRWYSHGFGVRNGPTRYGNVSFAVARQVAFASRSVRRALLTPQVMPGSRYRCAESA